MTFLQCANPIVDTTGDLYGVIIDAETKEPIQGVTVTIVSIGISQTTSIEGKFWFHSLEQGMYEILVTAPMYQSQTKNVAVFAGISNISDFVLSKEMSQIELSATSLSFGNESTLLSFDIINNISVPLRWELIENSSWMTCNPVSGELKNGKQTIAVKVLRDGLSPGTYNDNIIILSNGGSAVVSVSLDVSSKFAGLTITPSKLDFGSLENNLNLILQNSSGKSISYTLDNNKEWIQIGEKIGTVSTSKTISISVNRTSLPDGKYDGDILIRVSNEEVSIPVNMEVAINKAPEVALSAITEVEWETARAIGTMLSVGSTAVTSHGFCYGTKEHPTVEDNKVELGGTKINYEFVGILKDLLPNTKYYVRAYATNSMGTSYSNKEISFTTKSLNKPSLADLIIDNITTNNARVIVSVKDDGGSTIDDFGIYFGTSKESMKKYPFTFSVLGNYAFTFNDKLSPSTIYYVKGYAMNSIGTTETQIESFKTKAIEATAVDLGLSVNWATCNIGATNPEDAGLYFAWGEVVGYSANETHYFDEIRNFQGIGGSGTTYSDYGTSKDPLSNYVYGGSEWQKPIPAKYDAATQILGDKWRLPTKQEYSELFHYCQHEAVYLNNVRCFKFTSLINGNSIMFPIKVGSRKNAESPEQVTDYNYYWCGTSSGGSSYRASADCFWIVSSSSFYIGTAGRYIGCPIRAVKEN